MKNVKRMLLIGVLATASIIGTGCGKSDKSKDSSVNSESTVKESGMEETTTKQSAKKKFIQPESLGTIGWIDLDSNNTFPKAGFIPTAGLTLGFDENKGELASCFFNKKCIEKLDAEETWHVEYSEEIDKIPDIMKRLTLIWDSFLEDSRLYKMYSSQQYEVVVDSTEKVTYNGVDFVKEEGHIDITRKDANDVGHPERVSAGYIAYYYFSPEDAGELDSDTMQGYGMGMAVWGVRPVDMSDEAEAKTMEENYEKLKKTAESSMSTLVGQKEYRSLSN